MNARTEPPVFRAIFWTLAAFLGAVIRPRTPLAKAIVLVLLIKLAGIAGIKVFMFPDGAAPTVDAAAMARVLAPAGASGQRD